jgi:prepilin-type N-terminal cleavage/methylation domain-containing protein
MNKQEKGFTLIELLVVIAIIGILSSIVLASLNSARGKGQDASASGSISSTRAEAEIMFDDDGSYSNVCTTGSDVVVLISAAVDANGQDFSCVNNDDEWRTSIIMKEDTAKAFCADSTGFAGKVTAADMTTRKCN